ncbi:Vacuolar iron transporter 1.1 [Fusarium oxysporum f. sp. albedinis]|nr:Vacuolar iron transporter 1.1 [Fusarium oxysporum f. sp. albedinis]
MEHRRHSSKCDITIAKMLSPLLQNTPIGLCHRAQTIEVPCWCCLLTVSDLIHEGWGYRRHVRLQGRNSLLTMRILAPVESS